MKKVALTYRECIVISHALHLQYGVAIPNMNRSKKDFVTASKRRYDPIKVESFTKKVFFDLRADSLRHLYS